MKKNLKLSPEAQKIYNEITINTSGSPVKTSSTQILQELRYGTKSEDPKEQFINGIKVGILAQKYNQVEKLCESLKRVLRGTKTKKK